MKKKILLSILVLIGLFTVTGCGNKTEEKNNTKEQKISNEKVDFTETVKITECNKEISFNLPKGYKDEDAFYSYTDMGMTVHFRSVCYGTDVAAYYDGEDEDSASEIKKINVNGKEFEYFTYKDYFLNNTDYVLRGEINGKYYLFTIIPINDKPEYSEEQAMKLINSITVGEN